MENENNEEITKEQIIDITNDGDESKKSDCKRLDLYVNLFIILFSQEYNFKIGRGDGQCEGCAAGNYNSK